MNCPQCGWPVADNALGCRSCLTKRALSDALAIAAARVPEIASGRLLVRLRRKTKYTGPRHIALVNFPTHSWCGVDLSEYGHTDHKALPEALNNDPMLCALCVNEINKRIKVER